MKRTHFFVAAVAAVATVCGVVAWEYWPGLLRFREERVLSAARITVARYISDQDSLPVAVCRLASQLRRVNEIESRRLRVESFLKPRAVVRLHDYPLTPPGISPDDPRVLELTLNALRFPAPSEMPPGVDSHLQAMHDSTLSQLQAMRDSTLRARGFRSVECAA